MSGQPVFNLPGYAIAHSISDDGDFLLLRGRRVRDGIPVLLKLPSASRPSPRTLRQLEHEALLAPHLDHEWSVPPLAFERHVLVLEGFEGMPLDTLPASDLESVLSVAIGIARALEGLHRRHLIHKDLRPSHILVDPSTGAVRLTGFGIATLLPVEPPSVQNPTLLEGALAYMSPEQTGRMNRAIDYRTDFYSLGVTLYQMLTGVLPCEGDDPLEWVHCHIAVEPTPPADREARIPRIVSDLVMKLLSKDPEERYQTAAGLRSDLERCLFQLRNGHLEAFPLGESDVSDVFRVPQKLYGREWELATLRAAFERVLSSGTPELVLVSGYSGIGKTTLVNELHASIIRERGFYLAGKFDQYKRDIPYAIISQAFGDLVRQLLTLSEARLETWRRAIQEAVGIHGQLLVDLIPDLELIIGRQRPVAELQPTEAQNRFHIVFMRFLGVFSRRGHPLVIFLDDLQWVDGASLALVSHLITQPDAHDFLVIGAYRDNEVNPAHPLMLTIDRVRTAQACVRDIVLGPLRAGHLQRLLGETFRCSPDETRELAELLHEKTGGNPFFVIQFLATLHQEGLLAFTEARTWRWDLDRIRAMGYTDNVVELLLRKMGRFSGRTRHLLMLAAFLGNEFDLSVLSRLGEASETACARDLQEAVREGLILPSRGPYRFLHDRVQQAAYTLANAADRPEIHLRVGRLMAGEGDAEALGDSIFDVVGHLNQGADLMADEAERLRLMKLNAAAGRKAKTSLAYGPAQTYLAMATQLMPEAWWSEHYDWAFTLAMDLAEVEYLSGNFDQSDALFESIRGRVRSDLDRAAIAGLRMRLYQVSGRYRAGFWLGVEALRLFGLNVPESEQAIERAIAAEKASIDELLRDRPISDLAEAPDVTDPAIRTVIELLADAAPCAYIGAPEYFPLIALNMVTYSLRYGNAKPSCFGYSIYGFMLVSLFDDIPSGYAFSEMSLRLNERYGDIKLRGTLLHLHGDHINFWCRPIATDFPILDQAFLACIEAGDLVYAGFLAFETVWQAIERGDELGSFLAFSRKYEEFARRSRNEPVYQTIKLEQQFARALMGETPALDSLSDASFDESAALASVTAASFGCGVVFYHIMKLIACYLNGDERAAQASMTEAEAVLGAAMAMPIEATFTFFKALLLAALPDRDVAELERLERKLALWAHHAPENFQNRHALVSAELARLRGDDLAAMGLYEQAIRSARENGFVQHEAIANELAARFHLARGFETISLAYLKEAANAYARWGAMGKVSWLEARHPQLRDGNTPLAMATVGTTPQQLDLLTAIKASQAISQEIDLPRLAETLMRSALLNAGARRACLLLVQEGLLRLMAEAHAERTDVVLSVEQPRSPEGLVPEAIANYVRRTSEKVVLPGAMGTLFASDPYMVAHAPRSVLCVPILKQAKLIGLLYLENDRIAGAFTPDKLTVLDLLASQVAISLENARLYSDLRRSEAAVREREVLLRTILDNTTAVIYLKDAQGRYLFVNRWHEKIFRIPRDEIRGKTDDEVFPAEMAAVFRASDRQVLEGGSPRQFEEDVVQEGVLRTYISVKFPLFDEAGNPTAMCGVSTDVTELKKAEQERQRLLISEQKALAELTAAKQLDRLKTDFVNAISHDLRTPLTSIKGYAEFLEDEIAGPVTSQQREFVEQIEKGASRLEGLVDDLLDFARIEAGTFRLNPEVGDFGLKIREIVASVAPQAKESNITIEVGLRDTPLMIRMDPQRIERLLANLLCNAIKFTPSGGRIWLRVRREADHVRCEVEDNGLGIAAEDIPKLFQRFSQLEPGGRRKGGSGLGLSIAKTIVEAHGGTIGVSSVPGKGSTFWFTLPQEADQTVGQLPRHLATSA